MSLISYSDIKQLANKYRNESFKVVFTNGCFDLLHKGHRDLLLNAAKFGDKLIVGLNSDSSTKKIKGPLRPIENEKIRSKKLLDLPFVDHVVIFKDLTPKKLIYLVNPNVLVKGGDYNKNEIIGANHVISQGGNVKIIPLTKGYSTTSIIKDNLT